MKVPKDQGLFLTVFISVCVTIILVTWALLPMYHRESEEMVREPIVSPNLVSTPKQLIKKTEGALRKAEAVLSQFETDEEGESD